MSQFAVIFPGQGSQSVGMLAEIAAQEPAIEATFEEASTALGYDLWALTQEGPEEQLNQTEFTQPALLAASVALWRVWLAKGGKRPEFVAGHSLGEYSALVCAEVLRFGDAVDAVRRRGQFMQTAVPLGVGTMAAILGLEDQQVIDICAQASGEEVVDASNFNAPGQVVVSGNAAAVQRAIELCQEAGARRAMQLAVSAPFHCRLMKPAADRMAEVLDRISFSAPAIEVVQNVNAMPEADPEKIKANLVAQMASPVLWTDTVRHLVERGVEATLECGPGQVLSGFNRRIDRAITSHGIGDPAALAATLSAV